MSNVLKINWAYGFSKEVVNGVHNLTTATKNSIFFISSHSGVIYDFEHRTQMVLQGHCNMISCCAVSTDKRWIVTADIGEDPIMVVWDATTGAPVKTIFSPHAKGVKALDISSDALYITTLGESEPGVPQEVAIWAWTKEEDDAILRKECPTEDVQQNISFDSSNASEVVTTGKTTVCFWSWGEFNLEVYMGKVSKTDLGGTAGAFVSTVFLPGSGNALTTTKGGSAVLWESQFASVLLDTPTDRQLRTASKIIRLVECAINFVTTTPSGYVVVGCSDGTVKFYDFTLRLEAWFEDLAAGPVNSISFAAQENPYGAAEAGAPGLKFWTPDFMIGTTDALIVGVESCVFDEVRPEDRRGTLLMQGMTEHVSNVACHPSRSLVAFASYNGSLQIWDYDMKLLMNLREFNNRDAAANLKGQSAAARLAARNYLRPNSVAFEPNGEFVAVGFTSGHVKFLDIETFADVASFAPTVDSVSGLQFSKTGVYLACYDSSNHVLLFKKSSEIDPATLGDEAGQDNGYFFYLGRTHSHGGPITGLQFGMRDGMETLVSVGQDRRCVEYDLEISTVISGIATIDSGAELDLNAQPSALMWSPITAEDPEEKFIVANDEFKLKEFNVESKQCRKTALSPTYGGPPNKMLPIISNGGVKHYAYSTESKVIGVGCLPITGNPSEVIGLVAHPSQITCICTSFDGRYVFSSGGKDLSVNMWLVDTTELQPEVVSPTSPPEEMSSYLSLLEGGQGGGLHNDIVDYFYYCQLRTQGEDAMEARDISGKIPIKEIPSLVRSVGFYPSEEEVTNMINEVRYKTFMVDGEMQESITINDFIKLYINHRPVLPLNNTQILDAFSAISSKVGEGDQQVLWGALKKMLISEGESIATGDLEAYLTALVGSDATQLEKRNEAFDAQKFSDMILGFEDFNSM